ncbi:probable ubiquitin-conjugating enzyme E2 24 [Arachis duranensis]|uniref:E2 ubiquitin-conjugating enzyme n=1 Tax=Arachis duranensis TaxID=130453 RepID=A0A6P4CTK5_ARADU|nr:probable ubiquitin-conjugating enzyme E2 24 [Arachis duranensis]
MTGIFFMDALVSDSDWETNSESNSEYQEDIDFLYGGQAQSILSSLEESIGKIDGFLSFERAFVHGDVVCSLADPSGQMGRVIGVDMFVDLENVQGKVYKNVNSKKLRRIRSVSEGDHVIKGSWLGRVHRVAEKVTVLMDDGVECDIIALEKEKLLPLTQNFPEDFPYPYYSGQRVKVKSPSGSKSARWLCGTWRDYQDEGTVCAVEAGLVYVKWLASVATDCSLNVNAPLCWQDSKNLTVLSCFSHANWQLGDWCMLSVAEQKEHIAPTTMVHKMARGYKRRNLDSRELFTIGKIKTKVDVVWQNGEHSTGLDPEELLPVNVINAHEFWPHQFVLEKCASYDPLKPNDQRWGVVRCVDALEHTVKVQWKAVSISNEDNFAGDKTEETVSAYELVEHPDYSFCFGDIVFAAQKQLGDQAGKDNGKSVTDLKAEATLEDGNQVHCLDEFPDNPFLCCVGNVTGFEDGNMEVNWANGFTTKVAPYEVFRIEKPEGSAVTSIPHETNVDELPQEIIEHRSLPSDKKEKDLLNSDGVREICEKQFGECSSFSLPRAAFELFSSIKASIFQTLGATPLSGAVSSVPTYEEENGSDFLDNKDLETCNQCTHSHPVDKLQFIEEITPNPEVIKTHEHNDSPFSFHNNNSNQFQQFDIIENCSDHHFFGDGRALTLSQVKRGWAKKVQQEWNILEKNLPETIYVRVFEERMDLMRAAIVGASGTPYHDGMFFFDICFPPEYPNEPPMVHYKSGGLRLNPNLYESGRICLSLLNTWTGAGSEVWNPRSSTILQVLISLQALVLNEKPYFNEAGYDQQIGRAEGEKNSVSYNENAFLVTTKSMLYLLRNPPKHFEALLEEHFRKRSKHILLACKAYIEGAPIGCGFECAKTELETQKGTSTGFKIMLSKILPKLVEAFSDMGIDCSHFVEHQNSVPW